MSETRGEDWGRVGSCSLIETVSTCDGCLKYQHSTSSSDPSHEYHTVWCAAMSQCMSYNHTALPSSSSVVCSDQCAGKLVARLGECSKEHMVIQGRWTFTGIGASYMFFIVCPLSIIAGCVFAICRKRRTRIKHAKVASTDDFPTTTIAQAYICETSDESITSLRSLPMAFPVSINPSFPVTENFSGSNALYISTQRDALQV